MSPQHAVHVTGYDFDMTTVDDLTDHMGSVGTIAAVDIVPPHSRSQARGSQPRRTSRSVRSYALVYYMSGDAVLRACAELDGSTLFTSAMTSHAIRVQPKHPRPEQSNQPEPGEDDAGVRAPAQSSAVGTGGDLKMFVSWSSGSPWTLDDVRTYLDCYGTVHSVAMSPQKPSLFANVWVKAPSAELLDAYLAATTSKPSRLMHEGWELRIKQLDAALASGLVWPRLPAHPSHPPHPPHPAHHADAAAGAMLDIGGSFVATPAGKCIVVSKLPKEATKQEVQAHCAGVGSVTLCHRMERDAELAHLGQRFLVVFAEAVARTAVRKLNKSWVYGEKHDGRKVDVGIYGEAAPAAAPARERPPPASSPLKQPLDGLRLNSAGGGTREEVLVAAALDALGGGGEYDADVGSYDLRMCAIVLAVDILIEAGGGSGSASHPIDRVLHTMYNKGALGAQMRDVVQAVGGGRRFFQAAPTYFRFVEAEHTAPNKMTSQPRVQLTSQGITAWHVWQAMAGETLASPDKALPTTGVAEAAAPVVPPGDWEASGASSFDGGANPAMDGVDDELGVAEAMAEAVLGPLADGDDGTEVDDAAAAAAVPLSAYAVEGLSLEERWAEETKLGAAMASNGAMLAGASVAAASVSSMEDIPMPVAGVCVASTSSAPSVEGLVQKAERVRQTLDLPAGLSMPIILRRANEMMGLPNDDGTPLPDVATRLLQSLGI